MPARLPCPLLATLVLSLLLHPLLARPGEPAGASAPLREITVTARKREEALGEVPGSLAVLDLERLRDADIDRLADLGEFVPGLTLAETGTGAQLLLRGAGSGNNQAFEQSVGLYLDGIHYARQPLLRSAFLDLARVEVLRGPQGVLFGKNSIAGALNLVSALPGATRELQIESLLDSGSAARELNAAGSTPLGRDWALRLALREADGPGFLHNPQAGRHEPLRDEAARRLTLSGEPGGFSLTLKAETNELQQAGRAVEVLRDEPNSWPPGSHPLAGLNLAAIHSRLGLPALDARQDFRRQGDPDDGLHLDMENLTFTLRKATPFADLALVSGRLRYRQRERCDCDFSPATLFSLDLNEDYHQESHELRLSAPAAAQVDWIGGLYLQRSRLHADEALDLPPDSLFGVLAQRFAEPRLAALGLLADSAARRANRQDNRAWSLFAQAAWPLRPGLQLSLGGRFTQEQRRATRRLDLLDAVGGSRDEPVLALAYRDILGLHSNQLPAPPGAPVGWRGHELRGQRQEAQFSPQAALEGELASGLRWHIAAQRGFKAGGFDARGGSPAAFEFAGEEVQSLESGLRGRLLEGRLAFALNSFVTVYRNLQVSQYDGRLGFTVGNAPRSLARGLELDGRWALTPRLRLDYAWSWLDFRYRDFPAGNCHAGQTPDSLGADAMPRCDYSGQRGKFAPRQALSLVLQHERPLWQGWTLSTMLHFNQQGSRMVHDNLDPAFRLAATRRLNLRVALRGEHWELGMIGRNLGNARLLHYAADLPVAGTLFGTRSYYAALEGGRQWSLELRYRL